MILFIDLRSQGTGHRFAFFNTVSDVFCDFYGDQAWSDKDEFVRSFNLYVTNCIAGKNYSIDRFLRLMPPWAEKSSKDEGDACPFDRCIGVLRFAKVQNCSCHISPPCGECENRTLHCSKCGWSPGDPEEPPAVVEKASQLALDVSLETARSFLNVTPAMKVKLIKWIREKRAEAEKHRRAREQMAETFMIGSDAEWRAAAKAHGGPVTTKSDRDKESAMQLRIAARYQDDVDLFQLLLNVMEKI